MEIGKPEGLETKGVKIWYFRTETQRGKKLFLKTPQQDLMVQIPQTTPISLPSLIVETRFYACLSGQDDSHIQFGKWFSRVEIQDVNSFLIYFEQKMFLNVYLFEAFLDTQRT